MDFGRARVNQIRNIALRRLNDALL